SQTGTAEGLARRVAREAAQRGFGPRVRALNDCQAAELAAGGKTIIISSTWGDGEPPDNAVAFWSWLSADTAPSLENLQFAILGLGDRNYSDFCGASKKFDTRLADLGAKRLLDRGECDVDYEAAARAWTDRLWETLKPGANGHAASPVAFSPAEAESGERTPQPPIFSRTNPFPARLLKNLVLNQPDSGKEVRHYEISLEGSGLTYAAGDALGVVPVNCPGLVADIMTVLRCDGDAPVKIGDLEMPLREAMLRHLDISKPSQELVA